MHRPNDVATRPNTLDHDIAVMPDPGWTGGIAQRKLVFTD
jgi:hypothetical protein